MVAGRDNVLYHARMTANVSAGTVVPLAFMKGIENVRQGYGTAKLKNVRAWYAVADTDTNALNAIPVSIKNSNWVDSAGLSAQKFKGDTALSKGTLAFMRGRDKELLPNTTWTISATMPAWTYNASTAPYIDIFVLIEIEYSAVPGINTENTAGSPVMKQASNASDTGSANVPVAIGTFDNLLQGITYILSEVSEPIGAIGTAQFLIVEGFSAQAGLIRIIPIKADGMADQIEGSVYLTKQTYNLSIISNVALSGTAVTVNMEMIASAN